MSNDEDEVILVEYVKQKKRRSTSTGDGRRKKKQALLEPEVSFPSLIRNMESTVRHVIMLAEDLYSDLRETSKNVLLNMRSGLAKLLDIQEKLTNLVDLTFTKIEEAV